MVTIISANKSGQLSFFDSNQGAKTGRWCKWPLYPDRCNCFDLIKPKTIQHHMATHYYLTWILEKERRIYYRNGACLKCADKTRKLYPIPEQIPESEC
jgi:hypothetical protein